MIPPEDLAAIRNRDDDAECTKPSCHQTAADRRVLLRELERLHSWDGLMELLDEHWPDDIFITAPDPEDYHQPFFTAEGKRANPGVIITGLIRWLDKERAR